MIPELERPPGEEIGYPLQYSWASLVAQLVKNLPPVQETWVQSLGWEDPLEEGMATQSSILAWRIPWTGEPGGLQSMGSHRVKDNRATNAHARKTIIDSHSWGPTVKKPNSFSITPHGSPVAHMSFQTA